MPGQVCVSFSNSRSNLVRCSSLSASSSLPSFLKSSSCCSSSVSISLSASLNCSSGVMKCFPGYMSSWFMSPSISPVSGSILVILSTSSPKNCTLYASSSSAGIISRQSPLTLKSPLRSSSSFLL